MHQPYVGLSSLTGLLPSFFSPRSIPVSPYYSPVADDKDGWIFDRIEKGRRPRYQQNPMDMGFYRVVKGGGFQGEGLPNLP